MLVLQQVYKTQLTKSTVSESHGGGGDESNKTARLFRGVAGDPRESAHRKGELFGVANLIRFSETSFVDYEGCEAKESSRFGGGMYDVDVLGDAAKQMEEQLRNYEDSLGETTF